VWRVFRYHQAAAKPPTSAEAAATSPTLAQLEDVALVTSVGVKASDSVGDVII